MSLPFVLPTKLRRPQLDGDLVWRDTLVARLDAALHAPLTLLSAPAGSGKTTLVCQWLDHLAATQPQPVPVAWLSLDERDGDLTLFLPAFVAALRSIFPDACPRLLDVLDGPRLPNERHLATTLASDLEQVQKPDGAAAGDFIVVLDDYDQAVGSAIHALLTELLRYPPHGMHLVVVSRADPALPLSRLRANRQLVELRSRDLRLTDGEVAQMLRADVPMLLNAGQITALVEQTEGWAAAVHLASISLRESEEPAQILANLAASPQNVASFLLDEVLARQPAVVREALLRLSVFERFCAPLIEAVCPDAGSGSEMLRRLQTANLFIAGLDAHDEWFRFNHLFRDLLRRQLVRRYGAAEVAALHRRGSAWFAERGLIEEALRYALAGDDIAAAAAVFARYRPQLMNDEQWLRLDRWLRLFPTAVHADYPDLLLARAWLTHTFSGGILAVKNLLPEIDASLVRAEQRRADTRYHRAELDVLRGMLLYHATSDGPKCIFHTRRALDVLPRDRYLVRSYAWLFLAGGYQLVGETERAYSAISAGTNEDNIPLATARGRSLIAASFLYWVEGDLSAIALAAAQTTALGRIAARAETLAWAHHFLACVHYERNDLAEAEREAQVVLESLDSDELAHPMLLSAFVVARVRQAQGRFADARQVAEDILARCVALQAPTLVRVAEAFRADVMARGGDAAGARQWLDRVGGELSLMPMPLFYAPQLTPLRVLLAQNTPASRQQAADILGRLQEFVTATHNHRVLIELLALQALLHEADGRRGAALVALRQSLDLARPGGFVRVFVDCGPVMLGLLNALGRAGVYPDQVMQILATADGRLARPDQDAVSAWVEPLTPRETEVLALLAQRYTNKEIAHKLVISPETAKRHVVSCCRKLRVANRREAVAKARDLGMLPKVVS
ncbi:MAG: LuxR C-terminal-related transcriptional regulator [Anaerolineae bacterium]